MLQVEIFLIENILLINFTHIILKFASLVERTTIITLIHHLIYFDLNLSNPET